MHTFNQPTNFNVCNKQNFAQPNDYIFITDNKNQIYLLDNQIPKLKNLIVDELNLVSIGYINDCLCFCIDISKISDHKLLQPINIRTSNAQLGIEFFQATLLANHLNHWARTHRFCGICGNQTKLINHEWAMQCISCKHTTYTNISPCVIGIITHKNKILLAKNKNATTNIYSCIAGFVNPGENLETALARECMEEVGISIKNIQYIGSQQWPFPNSLMMGFTADYDSDDIQIDYNEIADAKWFSLDDLSSINLPNQISIAHHLITLAIEKIKLNHQ